MPPVRVWIAMNASVGSMPRPTIVFCSAINSSTAYLASSFWSGHRDKQLSELALVKRGIIVVIVDAAILQGHGLQTSVEKDEVLQFLEMFCV